MKHLAMPRESKSLYKKSDGVIKESGYTCGLSNNDLTSAKEK